MSSLHSEALLGQTLLDFSSNGAFPNEEAISAASVENSALPAALTALKTAKADLENEVRQISRETASDVASWITNAKSLQDDIEKSRRLAADIVRQAKADEHREDVLLDKQNHFEFISQELAFKDQLLQVLRAIQEVNDYFDQAQILLEERKILSSLRALEDASKRITQIPVNRSVRSLRLLEERYTTGRDSALRQLTTTWNSLVHLDLDRRSLTVHKTLPNDPNSLNDVVTGLQQYGQLERLALKLWEDLEVILLTPRTDYQSEHLPKIVIGDNSISAGEATSDFSIKSLLHDLEFTFRFLSHQIPQPVVQYISRAMMPYMCDRIKDDWLDAAVPSNLDQMADYQNTLVLVEDFAAALQSLDWPGVESFVDWVSNSAKIWLAKKRESALDWTRHELSLGVGTSHIAQRTEVRMLEKDESNELAVLDSNVNQDWDAAWTSDDDEKPTHETDARTRSPGAMNHSGEEDRHQTEMDPPSTEDEEDAWGWGDDEEAVDSSTADNQQSNPTMAVNEPGTQHSGSATRSVTISEKYWISSLPQPVIRTITQILNDGAELMQPQNEDKPVAAAGPALFSLPTLILAMYRALGPYYYAKNPSGNMYLYNDSMWMADQLKEAVTSWKAREDIPSRAQGLVRLDSEISILVSFGKRAYTSELHAQRTIINDLLGGTQNFLQDESSDPDELKQSITTVIKHIRQTAARWEKVLSTSASASALGSLVNAIAIRLIKDVFDMSSMSVTEAESAATVISLVESLDDLFIPSAKDDRLNGKGDPEEHIPLTAQFADQWMKMKYLSQVLQSNLSDIHFLWFESELSLYFTVEEVVDLIELSFENNPQVRNEIKQIKENPTPRSNNWRGHGQGV